MNDCFSGVPVDTTARVRAQSCKRRQARLDPAKRREIITEHNLPASVKIAKYYKLMEERRARELDLATRKAQVLGTGFTITR